MSDTPCPECLAGKHVNCDGLSWDLEEDVQALCTCQARRHEPHQEPSSEEPQELTITFEQLLASVCNKAEPCRGHTESAEAIWTRLGGRA